MKVIDGDMVWRLHATHGFPLELSLPMLAEKYDMVPAWDRLLEAAQRDGANIERLGRRIADSAVEFYGPEGGAYIRDGMQLLVAKVTQPQEEP